MDPYDKVRMQLIYADKKLYKEYTKTINELEANPKLQPRKRQMPFWYQLPAILIEIAFLAVVYYAFFLIIQLALFNLVIIGIILVLGKKLYQFVEALRWKWKFKYQTKDF